MWRQRGSPAPAAGWHCLLTAGSDIWLHWAAESRGIPAERGGTPLCPHAQHSSSRQGNRWDFPDAAPLQLQIRISKLLFPFWVPFFQIHSSRAAVEITVSCQKFYEYVPPQKTIWVKQWLWLFSQGPATLVALTKRHDFSQGQPSAALCFQCWGSSIVSGVPRVPACSGLPIHLKLFAVSLGTREKNRPCQLYLHSWIKAQSLWLRLNKTGPGTVHRL